MTIDPPVSAVTFRGVDYGRFDTAHDDRTIRTGWRVVEHVGNCCENYLAATQRGRLLNFGGSYVNVSDDRGKSWRQVRPLTPFVAGEGGIVAGPDGDLLGVAWDFNAGDQLQFFKYEADTEQWLYTQMPLHAPFFDRPWISVVPGPVTVNGTTHDYVSFVKGGSPSKELWFYSTDGLSYDAVTSKEADLLGEAPEAGPLLTTADPILDWVQPNANGDMVPLGGGRMLAAPEFPARIPGWPVEHHDALLDGTTFTWSPVVLSDGSRPTGRFQVDSAGRIHNVVPTEDRTAFTYRISTDGARTWRSVLVPLPPAGSLDDLDRWQPWDFRANRAAGVAAVALRSQSSRTHTGQDMVYKFDISSDTPKLTRVMHVGLGDVDAQIGTARGAGVPRQDFGSLALFADGRVALSFLDSTTTFAGTDGGEGRGPAIAIEGETEYLRK